MIACAGKGARAGEHWLCMVFDDGKEKGWAVDLSGGKRHLGESSASAAERETAEEISLHVEAAVCT